MLMRVALALSVLFLSGTVWAQTSDPPSPLNWGKHVAEPHHSLVGPEWSLVWGTALLCFVTGLLAAYTARLFYTTRRLATEADGNSRKALAASTRATETLVGMERAYLTGGGDIEWIGMHRCFRIEVANYGKTAAYLSGFYIKFATRSELNSRLGSPLYRRVFDDRIPPGERARVLERRQINHPNPDFIYGGFVYRDLQKKRHVFRFILRIQHPYGRTQPDVPRGVGERFRRWT